MFTRNFTELDKNDTSIAGGKGASLGEMTQTGIPVPPGFVILAQTFDIFIEEKHFIEEIAGLLDQVNHEDTSSVEKASEKIQSLILNAEIPIEIVTEVKGKFSELEAEFVAVRSSATAEDGASASWAGELESFLNTTEKTLIENIKRCWASLFTPRAIFYRFEKGLHKSKVSVAVVVQKMIQSEISGIAFSVHPVTEDKSQLIIEAGWGLGEAIVGGQVTPDSYVVDKRDLSIIDIYNSEQAEELIKKPNGGNEWVTVKDEKVNQQKLTREQIINLTKLIIKIEDHYNFPVDIEWALENDEIYITQSRPITTLS
jgi:pyruvate, water dikinase